MTSIISCSKDAANESIFQCADITFSSTVTSDNPSSCKNQTNVRASPFSGAAAARPANESTADGQAQSGGSSSPSGSSTASEGASTATSKAVAAPMQTAAWGVLGAALVGGLAVL
jgi:predicted carbohydrate-binding protein with CBM5 and CBM33 domain